MCASFTLNRQYGWVIISAASIGIQCFFTGQIPMGMRKEVFTEEFMEKNFGEIHRRELGNAKLPPLGYPDIGSGRYSDALSYKDWYNFNNRMRAHHNFVEQVGIVIPFVFASGLALPRTAAALGAAYFTGRLLYSAGYVSDKGPAGREVGAIIANLSLAALSGTTFYAGYRLLRYVKF